MPQQPTLISGDGQSIGQLARLWDRDPSYVRGLIADGKLSTDDSGRVTNASIRDLYRSGINPLDG